MSLIARCPACATLFRVVPDQLKISDGWVRCGQCSEVFDATASLQAAPPVPPPSEREPEPALESEQGHGSTISQPTGEVDVAMHASVQQASALEAQVEPEPEPESQARVQDETMQAAHVQALQEESGFTDPRDPVLEPGPLPLDASDPLLYAAPGESRPDPVLGSTPVLPPVAEPPLEDVSFVRQARRRAFWGSRGMRITLGVSCTVLGLLLAGQVVFHHRDRLALQVPALQPALAAMCASFQCRLGPPRRIESIAIESSAFTRVRADAFRLSLTLSNQADMSVATPALELTLTDLQDQPVLRRVLQPSDLGADAPQAIAPRTEWTSTLTLAVAPAANPARIVGYRVLAFYP